MVCALRADSSESPSAAFKAVFLKHMQRAPPAAPVLAGADLTQSCQRLEHQAARAWQSILQQDQHQAAEAEPVPQQDLPNKLDVAIANASQASPVAVACALAVVCIERIHSAKSHLECRMLAGSGCVCLLSTGSFVCLR